MTLRMAAHFAAFDKYTEGIWNYAVPTQVDVEKYKAAGFNAISFGEIRYGMFVQDLRDIFAGTNGWTRTNNPIVTGLQRIKNAGLSSCIVMNPNRHGGIDGFLNRPADVAEFMEILKYFVSIGIKIIEFEETAFYATPTQVINFWRQCRSLTPNVLLGCNMPSTQFSSVIAEGFDYTTINNEQLIDFVFPQPGKDGPPGYLITNERRAYAYSQWKIMMPDSAIIPFVYKTYSIPVAPFDITNVNIITNIQQAITNSWGLIVFPSSDLTVNDFATIKAIFATERGTVSISSTPEGASVTIDNIPVRITPITVFDPIPLDSGNHTITVSMAGYISISSTFTIIAGQNTILNYTLISGAPTTGTLIANSTPSANIKISSDNGVTWGAYGTTPKTITNIGLGTYLIQLSLPGYTTWTSDPIYVIASQTTTVTHTMLAEAPVKVNTTISTVPGACNIKVNGASYGKTPADLYDVPGTVFNIELSFPGYRTILDQITLTINRTLNYTLCSEVWQCEIVNGKVTGYEINECGDRRASTNPACIPSTLTNIDVIGCDQMLVGTACDLLTECIDQNGIVMQICPNITYSSNNTAVATVSADGRVTALKAGSATITVTALVDLNFVRGYKPILVTGEIPPNVCTWLSNNGGIHPMPINNISRLIRAYLGYENIGFTVTASSISGTIAYYSGYVSSGNALTGCDLI